MAAMQWMHSEKRLESLKMPWYNDKSVTPAALQPLPRGSKTYAISNRNWSFMLPVGTTSVSIKLGVKPLNAPPDLRNFA